VAPEALEFVYSGYVVGDVFTFTRPSKAFCHIAAYENHVNLGFNQGALLADPHRLLAGTGKRIRHIRIASAQDLRLPFRPYIEAAAARAAYPDGAPVHDQPRRKARAAHRRERRL
jgi:hypothetical protein